MFPATHISARRGRLVDMHDKRSDVDAGGNPRGRPRQFRQLPNFVVPQDFDAPLPEDEYAAWEDSADTEQEDGGTTAIT